MKLFVLVSGLGLIVATHAMPVANAGDQLPEIQFESLESEKAEGDSSVTIVAKMSQASAQPVSASVRVARSEARNHDRCTPQDYRFTQATISFSPGETSASFAVELMDDDFFEADEEVVFELVSPQNASLGEQAIHTLTIVDDDRPNMVSVMDFGAKADGLTDDRSAIQSAIDTVNKAGGGVVVFPEGNYLVSEALEVRPGITYSGYGANFLRMANQGKWENTFRQTYYKEDTDSQPLVIQGFALDGNSQNQGPYQDFELQQAHLINIMGNYHTPEATGRVRAYVEDVKVQNGPGDGVSIVRNVDARLCHIEAKDVFRGGLVVTGADSIVRAFDLTTWGDVDPTGIDVEIEGEGTVELYFENILLKNGDFDVSMSRRGTAEGGVLEGSHIVSKGSSFFLHPKKARVRIKDSEFWVGVQQPPVGNTIMQGADVEFENVIFRVVEDFRQHGSLSRLSEEDRVLAAITVVWNSDYEPLLSSQRILCKDCEFLIGDDVEPSDTVYVARTERNDLVEGSELVLEGSNIGNGFTGQFSDLCTTCIEYSGPIPPPILTMGAP